MAKQSFKDQPQQTEIPDSSPESAAAPETSSAVVERPSQAPAAPTSHHGQIEGEVDFTDMQIDRVNLAQKSGKLGDNFDAGSYVLGREVLLSGKGGSFDFIVLKIKKQYQEKVPYDPEGKSPKSKVFNTAEEVRAAGGHFTYGEEGYYSETATALILIPAPANVTAEEIESKFFYESGGTQYAIALWTFANTAYKAAKRIFTAALLGHLREGLEIGIWTAGADLKNTATLSWYEPTLKPNGKTDAEFQAFAKEVLASLN